MIGSGDFAYPADKQWKTMQKLLCVWSALASYPIQQLKSNYAEVSIFHSPSPLFFLFSFRRHRESMFQHRTSLSLRSFGATPNSATRWRSHWRHAKPEMQTPSSIPLCHG